jgi:hypothetical protein
MLIYSFFIGLVVVLIAAFIVSEFAYWLHWTIGSPTAKNDFDVQVDNEQIFSSYGRWLAKKYIQTNIANRSIAVQKAMPTVQNEIERGLILEVERARRVNEIAKEVHFLNPYKAFGVCIYCLATHIANLLQILFWLGFYISLDIKLPLFFPITIFIFFWSLTLFFLHKKLTSENE